VPLALRWFTAQNRGAMNLRTLRRLRPHPLPFALVLALGAAAPPMASGSSLEPCGDGPQAQVVVARLNALRRDGDAPCAMAAAVLPPLAWEARLASSAQQQAADLAQRDLLSHRDAQQRSFGTRLRDAGYAARGAGENLAAGQASLDDALTAWLASPAHCANLMRSDFRDVGLACVQRRGSRHERFWVAHLGAPLRP
jgi:uncharacterized protein YkwD